MNTTAIFLVTHGSRDPRSWQSLQDIVTVARSQSHLHISGGCLEGQELTLSQQLESFATEVIQGGGTEIAIVPLFLLEGVHVSEDIPAEIAIAKSHLQDKLKGKLQEKLKLRVTAHLGTNRQIPSLLSQHFEQHETGVQSSARIVMAHGSRRTGANQVVEDLANQSHAIVAYWGVEPKIETQIENLLSQGFSQINVLPYFLNEGGITEAIARKIELYCDRAQIKQLPVPLSSEQIIDLALKFI